MSHKKVELLLTKNEDGHWLHFSDGSKQASINIENTFARQRGIIHNTIREWAKEQFDDDDSK